MSLATFRAAHPDGSRIDTDNYPKGEVFQCVDLIKQYLLEEAHLPLGTFGDAKDYWGRTAAPILTVCSRVASKAPVAGDITVLSPNHIGIATGKIEGDNFEMLEQNGSTGNGTGNGPDAIRTRMIPKSRIMGILRINPPAPAPTPPPAAHVETVSAGKTWYIRSEPNASAAERGVVSRGDSLATEVLGNSWRRLLDGRGFVSGQAFAPEVAAGHSEVVKNGSTWFVRDKPDMSGKIVGAVKRGDVFETEVVAGGWRRLKTGPTGFVGPKAFI